jgi:hypothetical protein
MIGLRKESRKKLKIKEQKEKWIEIRETERER